MELESDTWDVVVIGTGLAESIAAASLAKIGKSVLHLDPNEYYAADQASLTLDELTRWAEERSGPSSSAQNTSSSLYVDSQRRRYTHASTSALTPQLEKDKRRYALSLYPAVLPSRGPLITTLVNSGVSKYVGFRLLDSVGILASSEGQAGSKVKKVPGSKEEVFKDKSISLVDKRRLMKFLMFVAGEFEDDELLRGKEEQPLSEFLRESFSLPDTLASQIVFAIAHCSSPDEPTLEALTRTRRYLQSIGKYGNGAFLVAQYGGAGEIAQGFCRYASPSPVLMGRACAVKGGTYILGEQGQPSSVGLVQDGESKKVRISLPCHPNPITASHLITGPDHLPLEMACPSSSPSSTIAHCIAVLPSLPDSLRKQSTQVEEGADEGEGIVEQDDTAMIIFPPEGETRLVRGLIMGEGTGSCPNGQYVLYLSSSVSSEALDPADLVQPYLERLHSEPLFKAFYLASGPAPHAGESAGPVHIVKPYAGAHTLTEGLDWEAEQGEAAFWAVLGKSKEDAEEGQGFFEREEKEDEVDEDLG